MFHFYLWVHHFFHNKKKCSIFFLGVHHFFHSGAIFFHRTSLLVFYETVCPIKKVGENRPQLFWISKGICFFKFSNFGPCGETNVSIEIFKKSEVYLTLSDWLWRRNISLKRDWKPSKRGHRLPSRGWKPHNNHLQELKK